MAPPAETFPVPALFQTLENGLVLAEALLFPEFSICGDDRARLEKLLDRHARDLLREEELEWLHRRMLAALPRQGEAEVALDPPRHGPPLWTEKPLRLSFPFVAWPHGEDAWIARAPELSVEAAARESEVPVEAIARKEEDLEESVAKEIRFALARTKAGASLQSLCLIRRARSLEVGVREVAASIPSRKRRALDAGQGEEKSVLKEVAEELSANVGPPAREIGPLVERIAEALSGREPSSVLLVGPSGVGKTAAFRELARRRASHGFGRTPFWATSGSRLVAGMSGFGMWQERCEKLCREAAKTKAVLHLGSLGELAHVGKSELVGQGVASFLRPRIARGELLCVAECLPEQAAAIEREDPRLLDAFRRIDVEEPSREACRAILKFRSRELGGRISDEGLDALERLHRRHATYSAWPGRPLRFLENLLADQRARETTAGPSEVARAFSRETGLPLFMLDDAEPLDLEALDSWLAERVLGQPEATRLAADLLAAAKAAMGRPDKPIASLLFIGPTGVGKTRLARALAEFMFGSEERLARFDMSEFNTAQGVERLIGGPGQPEGLLTARMRDEPFGVLLFDEFEKAHPWFFDLLLQILGEGRLTDSSGRPADFRNAIIVMTSNLGARSAGRGGLGFGREEAARRDLGKRFMEATRSFLRPELFNRIDRVAPFGPLEREATRAVAEREISLARAREGIRHRKLALEISPEAAAFAAERGFDIRYGARPLKRAIERELLLPLAERLNQYAADLPLAASVGIDPETGKPQATVRALPPSQEEAEREKGLLSAAQECAALRRKAQKLRSSSAINEIESEAYRMEQEKERLEKRRARGRPVSAEEWRSIGRLPALSGALKEAGVFRENLFALEDEARLALMGRGLMAPEDLGRGLARSAQEWKALLRRLYRLRFAEPDRVLLAVFGEEPAELLRLARAYEAFGRSLPGGKVQGHLLATNRERRGPQGPALVKMPLEPVEAPSKYFWRNQADMGGDAVGVLLEIFGEMAFPLLQPEDGVHAFLFESRKKKPCLVNASPSALEKYQAPEGVEHRGNLPSGGDPRRVYRLPEEALDDPALEKKRLPIDDFDKAIGRAVLEKFDANLEALAES